MVFSTNTILASRNRSFPIKETKDTDIENKSFFFESLQLISEDARNTYRLFQSFHLNEVITESENNSSLSLKSILKRIDFKKILINLLNSFMNLLEKLWNNFHALLLNLFGQDKVINRYKDKIKSIDFAINYSEDRYIYTNLGGYTTLASYKSTLENELGTLQRELTEVGSLNQSNKEVYVKGLNTVKQNMIVTDQFFDSLRGNILNSRSSIKEEEFANALFKYFRNNGNKVSSGNIGADEIKSIYNEYFNNRSDIQSVINDKNDLIKTSKKIQSQIKSLDIEKYINDNIGSEASSTFVSILELEAKKVQNECNIFLQVFGAKLDALKESYIQYRRILYTAAQEIVRKGA